jgi:hypothetical protein
VRTISTLAGAFTAPFGPAVTENAKFMILASRDLHNIGDRHASTDLALVASVACQIDRAAGPKSGTCPLRAKDRLIEG